MDPTGEEQIDYGDEEYGVNRKTQYHGAGAISALADEEMMGEDDDYDDLYNDVNVGEGFLQMHRSEAPPPATLGNGGLQAQKIDTPVSKVEAGSTHGFSNSGVAVEGLYSNTETPLPEKRVQLSVRGQGLVSAGYPDGSSVSQKGQVIEIALDAQFRDVGFQGSTSVPPNIGADIAGMPGRMGNNPALAPNPNTGVPHILTKQTGMNPNVNHVDENEIRPSVDNGLTTLYIGELHWWTTDAELESVLSQYGRVKEIKFFDERASGKSKGYCQVEFYDPTAAAACKEGMNGYLFNGRPCVVAFASPQTLKQMGASYNKNQPESQPQPQGRRPMNDGIGRGNNMNYQGGDGGRNYGRGSWGRGGQGMLSRGPGGGGHMRGRGGMGAKNMGGAGIGGPVGGGGPGGYGQGLAGPAFGGHTGGMMHPQGMMGAGFDPTYMGRGGYGGFPGPGFPGMLPSFPAVNAMGLAGMAPHVNPAFFSQGMAPNGIRMMGSSGMDGHHAGVWADSGMGAWGGEEQNRRTRESSYGGDDGASEYGYGEVTHEKGGKSTAASREKDRGSDRDWSGNTDRRQRDEREQEWDRPEREHRYREEKDNHRDHRQRERDSGYKDDLDRGQSSSRPRSRSRAMPEESNRSRKRDVDFGKRRRMPSE